MRPLSDHATLLPVSLLTGFLGSGKTTLLGKLLRSPQFADTAVIINEFGEMGLDHHLIEKVDNETVLIDSGCICCTVRDDLAETLAELYRKREAGTVPPFRRVVIETTGLADPTPILHTLMTHEDVAPHFGLDGVIATVDAVNGAAQLDAQPESVKQAAVADRIVLTKSDLAKADDTARLTMRLNQLNPGAPVIVAVNGETDPGALFDAGLYDPRTKSANVQAWLREEAVQAAHAHGHDHHHHDHDHCEERGHEGHRHDAGIDSFLMTFDAPLDWDVLANRLGGLTYFHGDSLLRVKGILNVAGEPGPIAVHAVQHLFHEPTALADWPGEDRRSRLVFITRDLDRDIIERALRGVEANLAPAASDVAL
jgi:G3E family GTPase